MKPAPHMKCRRCTKYRGLSMEYEESMLNYLIDSIKRNDKTKVEEILFEYPYVSGILDRKGTIPFLYAAATGKFDIVRSMIKASHCLNVVDENGKHALWHALVKKHEQIANFLVLFYNFDLTVLEDSEPFRNMFSIAAENKFYDFIKLGFYKMYLSNIEPTQILELLDSKDQNEKGILDYTNNKELEEFFKNFRLLVSCKLGDIKTAEKLMKEGADPDFQFYSLTPLIESILSNEYDITKMLLDKGAKVNHSTMSSPLSYAISSDQYKTVEYFISKSAGINLRDENGDTPVTVALHTYKQTADRKILDLILKQKPDVEIRNLEGYTAVETAFMLGFDGIFKNKIDESRKKQLVQEMMFEALSQSDNSSLKYALEKGADPNKNSGLGEAALNIAIVNGNKEAVEMLLKYKARPDFAGVNSPFQNAIEEGNLEIIKMLEDSGSKITEEQKKGVKFVAYNKMIESLYECDNLKFKLALSYIGSKHKFIGIEVYDICILLGYREMAKMIKRD